MHDAPTMALIVRQDLALSTGKLAAQCAHAAVDVVRRSSLTAPRTLASRRREKVVLGVDDLEAMHALHASIPSGCYAALVTDAGHTEVPAGTVTVLGIMGPRRRWTPCCVTSDAL